MRSNHGHKRPKIHNKYMYMCRLLIFNLGTDGECHQPALSVTPLTVTITQVPLLIELTIFILQRNFLLLNFIKMSDREACNMIRLDYVGRDVESSPEWYDGATKMLRNLAVKLIFEWLGNISSTSHHEMGFRGIRELTLDANEIEQDATDKCWEVSQLLLSPIEAPLGESSQSRGGRL